MSRFDGLPAWPGGCQRRLARWLGRRMFTLPRTESIISFTFDDFPRSALLTAGRTLEKIGCAGTYYVSLGLAGQLAPTGQMFEPDDLPRLHERGHELGCHTFDHCHAWDTSPAAFEDSIQKNAEGLSKILPGVVMESLSYPIGAPRPGTKRRAQSHFACCRGGGQTFNTGRVDLNYLAAFFLEQSRDQPEAIRQVIQENCQAGGWLIFATHDVADQPTRYGCTPALFEEVVKSAVESGARILPVAKALKILQPGREAA